MLPLLLLTAGVSRAQFATDLCAGDRFGSDLGCTANDVQITKIVITPGSSPPAGCTGGSSISLSLDVTMQFGSPSRWDVGVFLSQDGASPQLRSSRTFAGGAGSASCRVSTLPLGTMPDGRPSPFPNLEAAFPADVCGDGSKATVPTLAYASTFVPPLALGTGTATFTIPNVLVKCQSLNASGLLSIPFVVTWDNQSNPSGSTCLGNQSPVPNTTSKCSAPTATEGDVQVVTLPQITKTDGVTSVSPGDATTYTITVTNTTGVAIGSSTFRDAAVSNINVTGVGCTATGGATCPSPLTVAGMQAGVALGNMPNASSLVFTVNAGITSTGIGTSASPWLPAPNSALTNTASVTVQGVSTSASDANTVLYPNLVNSKTVAVVSDPIRGAGVAGAAALYIPGAVAQYTIQLANTGQGRVDTNTVVLTDPIPANTSLYYPLAAGATNCSSVGLPVVFTDGPTPSTLTFAAADLQYSSDGGATWTAAPAWAFTPAVVTTNGTNPAGCAAANITHLRANPKGRMAAGSAFTLAFNVLVR